MAVSYTHLDVYKRQAEDLASAYNNGYPSIAPYESALKKRPDNTQLKDLVENVLPQEHAGAYDSYFKLVQSGLEEPLTTHADQFNTNYAYSAASYSKGEVFVAVSYTHLDVYKRQGK